MKRLYLAGPMRGIAESNFPAFDAYAQYLRDQGYVVFSPAEGDRWLETTGRELTARECFELDTAWICRHAEGIALMPDWEKSRGATAEKALAEALDLEIIIL